MFIFSPHHTLRKIHDLVRKSTGKLNSNYLYLYYSKLHPPNRGVKNDLVGYTSSSNLITHRQLTQCPALLNQGLKSNIVSDVNNVDIDDGGRTAGCWSEQVAADTQVLTPFPLFVLRLLSPRHRPPAR